MKDEELKMKKIIIITLFSVVCMMVKIRMERMRRKEKDEISFLKK